MVKSARFAVVLFVATSLLSTVSGCLNFYHVGRKRRSLDAPELNKTLANFFGDKCDPLRNANAVLDDKFESLQSVVDYALRDTKWYDETTSTHCTKENDLPECWITALDFLLDSESEFYHPTAQCICEWAKDHTTTPCVEPPVERRKRRKRSISTYYRDLRVDSSCERKEIMKYTRTYPSLKRFNAQSVHVFLRDHYTYCRKRPDFPYEQRSLFKLLYIDQVCPRNGAAAEWRRNPTTVFKEATRPDGPLAKIVNTCKEPPTTPGSV